MRRIKRTLFIKTSKSTETVDAHAEDTEYQPSLSKASSLNNEFPNSNYGPNKLVVNSSGVESETENPDKILHSDSDLSLSDGDWAEMLTNFDKEDYFDALSDISDENVDNDLEDCGEVTDEFVCENLGFELGLWASSFVALLAVLLVYHPSRPKDPRTLLRTPRQSIVRQMYGGTYFHFCVKKALSQSKKLL